MRKFIAFLLFSATWAMGQDDYSLPKTPQRIEFANVIVNLDASTHKEVDGLVVSLLTPRNSYLDARLERMQWYFPYIEKILEEEKVPDDLKYLCVQESGLEPDALSSSGAVGYWQFKEPTAQELGLVINRDIDERKSILESTRAAAIYFKKNNIIYKNWLSSMYAYYQGPTGAAKDIPDNWSYASEVNFNETTPKYLLKALAHRIAFEHRLNRLKNSPKILLPYPTQNKSLAEIAVELTVDITELRNHNTWLSGARIPAGKDYVVMVPVFREREQEVTNRIQQRRELVSADNGYPRLKRVTMVTTSDDEPIFYEINGKKGILATPGDEAAQMAKKANVNLMSFLKLNDLTDKDLIKTGQVYYLEKKDKKGTVEFHAAAKGQTFWDVSQMYGIQLKKLLKMNRLKVAETLQPGRVVWLSKKRPSNKPVEIIQEIVTEPEEKKPDLPLQETYRKPEVNNVPLDALPAKAPEVKPEPPAVVKVPETPREESKVRVVERSEPPASRPKTPVVEEETSSTIHIVKQGETLFSLAKRYNLTVAELRALNNMSPTDVLQYNQKLVVSKGTPSPVASKPVPVQTAAKTEPVRKPAIVSSTNSSDSHLVEKGQTLYSISKMYNVSVEELKAWNGLTDNSISVGQSLNVKKTKATQTSAGGQRYTVKAGDTLFSISQRNGVSVSDMKIWNNLSSNDIKVGQVLIIR